MYPEGASSHTVCTVLAVKKKTHNQGKVGGSQKADLTAEDIAMAQNKGGTDTNICPSQDANRFTGTFFHLYMGHNHIHIKSIWTVRLWFALQFLAAQLHSWSH